MVDHGRWCHNSIDQVYPCQNTGSIAFWKEGHKPATNDTRDAADKYPGPSIRGLANTDAGEEREYNANNAGGGIEKGRDGASEAKAGYEGR